jgi:hypothetical protein
MIKFLKGRSRFLYRDATGKEHFEAMLICDTVAELAGVTEIDDTIIEFGSIALVTKEDKLCTFASDSKWYCEGAEVTADD